GSGTVRDVGPGAGKTFIRHPSEQERIRCVDQIALIGAHGVVIERSNPVHFSVWAGNEAIKSNPRGGNDVAHARFSFSCEVSQMGRWRKYASSSGRCLV